MISGRTAVITGGAQGIGLAIATMFADHGANIVIGDLDESKAKEAAEALPTPAVGVRCNVTSASDVQALVDTAVASFGSIDVMVNNAGITRDATMRKMTEEQFDQVIDVHLKGCWNGTRTAAGVMRENGGGSIINLSSISAKVGFVGQSNYSAAKAGLTGMSKSLAQELATRGITVNCVAPGFIRTAMTDALDDKQKAAIEARIPAGRMGEGDEIGAAVAYLASDEAAYVTGQTLHVNGGMAMLG